MIRLTILFTAILLTASGWQSFYKKNYRLKALASPEQHEPPRSTIVDERASMRNDLSKQIAENAEFDSDALLTAAIAIESGDTLAFAGRIYDIGAALNESVANTLQLSADAKKTLYHQLQMAYPDIAAEAMETYLAEIENLPNDHKAHTITYTHATRAEILSSVINSTACSFATLIFIPLGVNVSLTSNIAAGIFLQDPCEILLQYPIAKLGDQLKSSAIVKDVEATCTNIQTLQKSFLTDVSTAKMLFRTTSEYNVSRSIGFKKWSKRWESGKLRIEYIVSVAYGYDLSDSFRIEHDEVKQTIIVLLPRPSLISISLEPINTMLEDDGVPDVPNEKFTELYENARISAIQSAEKHGIQHMARRQMELVLANLFSPFTTTGKTNYTLRFK